MNGFSVPVGCALVGILLSLAPQAEATPMVGIERFGQFQPVGTLLRFDSGSPGDATIVGNIGVDDVGAMDVYQGEVWAASSDRGILSFYTIDVDTAQATLVSTARPRSESTVFGGAFDLQGSFWITDLGNNTLATYDPRTGQQLASVPIAAGLVIPGIEFVGDTLYAVAKEPSGAGHCLSMGGREALAFRRHLKVHFCGWRTTAHPHTRVLISSTTLCGRRSIGRRS